jgi:hypothetical protein
MEVFDGGLMEGTVWSIDKTIMFSPSTIDDATLSENGRELHMQMLGNAKSKFDIYNVFSSQMAGLQNIHSLVAIDSGTIEFPELNIKYKVDRGDLVAYRNDIYVIKTANFVEKLFAYNDAPKTFGSGSNLYEVVATIRDDYKISVYANSPEEALEIANQTSISEWRHPDVVEDAHLEDRRIIRHARWGNLSVNEIKD